jgi:hypothetical protein
MTVAGRHITGWLICSIAAIAILAPGTAAGKKHVGPSTLDVTNPVNATVPTRASAPDAPDGVLTSTIVVGKRFAGKRIRDVNITLQTTGHTGSLSAASISPILSAPNGATVRLFTGLSSGGGSGGDNIGPLTLDDESPLSLAVLTPSNPLGLYVPWIGTARPESRRLAVMDDGPVRGTWTLTVLNRLPSQSSVLDSWRLVVAAGRPFATR